MGMFDTILLEKVTHCTACGALIESLQTNQFGQNLEEYRIGDIVEPSPVITGIITEQVFCPKCHSSEQTVYLTIWQSLLTGIYADVATAEKDLLGIDRSDLLSHLLRHQRAERMWSRRFEKLYNELTQYHEYEQDLQDEKGADHASLRYLHITEHLKQPDPLASILENHNADTEEFFEPQD